MIFSLELPSDDQYRDFQTLALNKLGLSLGNDKAYLLRGRLQRRMTTLGINNYGDYLELIMASSGAEELQHFINAITTTKTDFFREREHFDWLSQDIFPKLKKSLTGAPGQKIRLWSAGCSSGQEAYSLAITALEAFRDELDSGLDLKILGTDINTDALAMARSGAYPAEALDSLSGLKRDIYFKRGNPPDDQLHCADKRLMQLIDFRQLNLLQQEYPIATRFHVILCRNVFYYFDPIPRQRVLERLSTYLVEGGWLVFSLTEIGYEIAGLVKIRGNLFQRRAS